MPLFVVAVPIGNPDDITLRAINCLKDCDLLIAEEAKPARIILKRLELTKEIFLLNEHTEKTGVAEELIPILKEGKNLVLISDCGTPLFADPGLTLVQACHRSKIPVIPVPGASSLIAALSVAGIDTSQFFYAGFLPRVPEDRQNSLKEFGKRHYPVVILDTPYRLRVLLEDVVRVLGKEQEISLMLALTKEGEEVFTGKAHAFLQKLGSEKQNREFVLVLKNRHQPPAAPKKKKALTRKRR